MAAWRLPGGCLAAAWRLPGGCLAGGLAGWRAGWLAGCLSVSMFPYTFSDDAVRSKTGTCIAKLYHRRKMLQIASVNGLL